MSFELTGNTLRSSSNTCARISGGSSPGTIKLPNNSVITAAYLYWSGSGEVDNRVTFDGNTVNSDTTYIETFGARNYFSAKADVTHLVSSNRSTRYIVSGVTFDGSSAYCNTKGAYAGWALAVIYENADEPLRVINVFDGFKSFWGEHFSLIPNNFVIAPNPSLLKGKHAHITWEGDDGNSQSKNGEVESLTFENNNLTDGNNPSNNQFNGYSNVTGSTSGVDIDEYEIGDFLTAGDTSVHTRYSSGQDAVFLTAEFISVPNEPVANLSIQQTGPANFVRGQNQDITLNVSNLGPNSASSNSQVTLPLPTGITLVNFSGNQWNCVTSTGSITCNYLNILTKNASASPLVLSLKSDSSTSNSINIVPTVTGIEFDNILSNNTNSKTYSVISADFTSSIKTVTDLNGGNVKPGDTLRYQIDLIESNGISASGITLTDHLPANIASFTIVSIPDGASNNTQPSPAGNNSTGLVSISGMSIAANATESIIIDAIISSSTPDNTAISNTATISGLSISDISIDSATVYISKPANPATGSKPLYVRQTSNLSRIQPTSFAFNTLADETEKNYVINPAFQQEFEFSNSNISAYLFLQNDDTYGTWNHTITVSLLHNNSSIGNVTRTISIPSSGAAGDNVALFEFTIPLSNTPVIQVGDTLTLKVLNDSQYSQDSLRIYSIDPNINTSDSTSPYSLVSLPAATVINVDQINFINSDTSQAITETHASQNLSIQAVVSDPFGSFDITSANISIKNPQGTTLINEQSMGLLSDSGFAIKTFSYSYSLPADAEIGDWIVKVTSKEGIENEIQHSSYSLLKVTALLPIINVTKSVEVYSDPIHGSNSTNNYSKALPGAILTYTIIATNTGQGVAENNSIWISDSIPDKTYMLVQDFDGISGKGPVIELPVNPTSGLSYQFITLDSNSDHIEFSDNNGIDFNYSPTADSEGIDQNITHFRVNPNGIFQAPSAGESANQFSLKFRVQLQ